MKKIFLTITLMTSIMSISTAQTLYVPNSVITNTDSNSSTNIGIGVSNPQEKLDIEGPIRIRNGSNSWRFVTNSSGSFSIKQTGYNGAVNIYNNGAINTNSLNIYNGNVGIGYTTPSHKLHVHGQDVAFYSLTADNNFHMGRGDTQKVQMMVNDNHLYFDLVQDADGNSGHVMFFRNLAEGTSENNDIRFQTSSENRLSIKAGGNVGIGTTSPDFKFDIVDDTEEITTLQVRNTSGLANSGTAIRLYPSPGGTNRPSKLTNKPDAFGANFIFNVRKADASYEDVMIVRGDGNVGIGTTTPEALLTVAGKIYSQEVKVTVDAGQGPDYVFEESYDLRSLEDTEAYIKANKHLPEIPSAKVMETEGLYLKEMNLKLLQKVEELTLHQIEQNKMLKDAMLQIELLKSELEAMKD